MGVVIKQSFWVSVIGYIGVVVGYVNTIVLRPEYMTPDEIGLISLIISNALMFAPITTVGMPGSYVRLVHQVGNLKTAKDQLFSFQLAILILAHIMAFFLAWASLPWIKEAFLENSPAYNKYIYVSFLILLFYSLFLQLNVYSRVELKLFVPEFLKNVFLRLGVTVLTIAFGLKWISLDQLITYLVGSYFLAFCINLVYISTKFDFRFSRQFLKVDRNTRSELLSFGTTLVFISIGGAIGNQIFFLLISTLIGLSATGIFTICFYIATVIEMPKKSMFQIIVPIFAKEFKDDKIKEIAVLYQKSSITLSVFAMLLLLGVVCNLDDLFNLIPNGSAYKTGAVVVVLVSAGKVIDMVFGFNTELINYSKDYRYSIILSIIYAILTIISCLMFIPLYDINGAALAFLISTFVINLIRYFFLRVRIGINCFHKVHITLLVLTILIYALVSHIPLSFNPILNIIFRSVFITIVYSISVYFLKISSDINNLARKILNRILHL